MIWPVYDDRIIMVIGLSGVGFGMQSYEALRNRTSAKRESDLLITTIVRMWLGKYLLDSNKRLMVNRGILSTNQIRGNCNTSDWSVMGLYVVWCRCVIIYYRPNQTPLRPITTTTINTGTHCIGCVPDGTCGRVYGYPRETCTCLMIWSHNLLK